MFSLCRTIFGISLPLVFMNINFSLLFSFAEESQSSSGEMTVLVVGGYGASFFKTTEIIPQSSSCSSSPLPHLPYKIDDQPSLIQTQTDEILLCGGFRNEKKCLELNSPLM